MISKILLIVGLGNPGVEYAKTRHNIGFLYVDYLASKLDFPAFRERFDALFTDKIIDGRRVILIKPQTYMNLSGKAVQQFVSFYKIKDIVVCHDDLDLKFADVRIKFGGSSGGHNGIKNIDALIGRDYWRIRIGIGRPENMDVKDYVLSKFTDAELNTLTDLFAQKLTSTQLGASLTLPPKTPLP